MRTVKYAVVALLVSSLFSVVPTPGERGFAQAQEGAEIDPYREFVQGNRLASAGALTRSIPHYENVIRVAGDRYPLAHFNLAEVLRQKKECARATVLYRAYIAQGKEEDVLKDAEAGIRECKGAAKWAPLTIRTQPAEATVRLDGVVVARGAKTLENVEFAPGEYLVEVSMVDHHPRQETITLVAGEPLELDLALRKQTFYGSVQVHVEPSGATIRLHPREQESSEVIEITEAMTEPLRLVAGKYFLEVTRPDYQRWIRNIEVSRDLNTEVSVKMTRALPPEIRGGAETANFP